MTLRILFACVRCRRIGQGDGYKLQFMWGSPAICTACQQQIKETV